MYVMEMNLEDIIAEKDEKDQRLLMAEFRNLGGYETLGEFFEDLEEMSEKMSEEMSEEKGRIAFLAAQHP